MSRVKTKRTSCAPLPGWERLEDTAEIPATRRIHVNRNLRMSAIEAIGFDMDHTLALYDARPFEELAFEQARGKLLAAGYPDEIRKLRYDASFVIRGLIVDKRRGNILKMDQHRYVARATHGTTPLPSETRKRIYQKRLVRLSAREYLPVDSPFSLPECDLYAQLVDLVDRVGPRPRDYRTLYDDVRRAVDEAHADGSIKDRIAGDPARYLVLDPELPRTLRRFKKHGYRLFLLTNSEGLYTALIMAHLLGGRISRGNGWTEPFDLVVVRAGKPDFFRNRGVATPIKLPGVDAGEESAKIFAGGGVRDLERLLGCGGDRILFFGDHTYGDILKSKRVCLWRTAMILQEVEREVAVIERLRAPSAVLHRRLARRERLSRVRDYLHRIADGKDGSARTRGWLGRAPEILASVEARLRKIDEEIRIHEEECDRAHNVYWGPTFRTEGQPSHFAAQVREFACLYTGRVSNFLYYPVDKYFQARPDEMPHER